MQDKAKQHLWEVRMPWNKKAPSEIALPTETYRELIERRKRYTEIRAKIENGDITEINDFITFNLNIRQFIQDILENTDDPDFIRHFFKAIRSVTILDPTCGSGAFLFAALNILEPLYEACIQRMEQFTADEPRRYKFFHEVLAEVNSEEHPNLQYYIYKSIILNNLYGVDIMHEAVEIAKLRLFLKMVGAVDMDSRKPNFGLEPLPDIDFNIRAGNTLVGFATEEELNNAIGYHSDGHVRMDFGGNTLDKFKEECQIVATVFKHFQDSQLVTDMGTETHRKAKEELQKRLDALNEKLNDYLASTYGIDKNKTIEYEKWLESHRPFHWFAEFYEIVNGNGGFDVVIGNPPYVEENNIDYSLNNKFKTTGNLYAFVLETTDQIRSTVGCTGMIIPLSGHSTKRMSPLIDKFYYKHEKVCLYNLSCDANPGILFPGVKFRLVIALVGKKTTGKSNVYTSKYKRWFADERDFIFDDLPYFLSSISYPTAIPKTLSDVHIAILTKLYEAKGIFFYDSGSKIAYYHNAPVNWIRSHSFIPFFRSERDGEKASTQLKTLYFDTTKESICASGIISSSLFFIHWISLSDCYHLNKPEIINFKFDKNASIMNKLMKVSQFFENDLRNKSQFRQWMLND